MTNHISHKDLEAIRTIFSYYPNIEKAILFGSRAIGKNYPSSDVDIALVGAHLEFIVPEVAGKLNDESPLPYFFDIIDYYGLTNRTLKEHIDRVGIVIYARDPEPLLSQYHA